MDAIRRWRCGPFDVDAAEHRLSRDGQPVPLARRSFALLVALLRRPGELVTKPELFATVWPDVVVGDAALSQAIHELRVALGDSASAPRFVATVHGLGLRLIAPVSALPAGGGRRAEAGRWLVGREADLQRLDDALAAARDGRRRTVFVGGEAGIGKTALVEAFVDRHAGDTVLVAQGRCIEHYGPGEAHLPILEALEQLARQAGRAFTDALSRYAPSWLAQLPWLLGEADAAARERASAPTTPQRMLRELAHALEVLSLRTTIVLWLEDLHWSDPSSLELIAFLAGRRDPARLLLIVSFRPAGAMDGAGALPRVVLRLLQREQADELPLAPLSLADVGLYLGLRLQHVDDVELAELAAFVHRRSEGNPLFAVSMVDDLVRRGELVEQHGRWRLPGTIASLGDRLPDSLRRLVHEQLEQLSDDDRRCVEAAAVVGASFNAAAAAAALQADPADTEDRCARLALQGRLLERQPALRWPDGTIASGFRFLHALYWQGVDERVPDGRRAEWQRRIALRLEQAFGAQCAAVASELALRFEAAHDLDRALRYLRLAGSAALARCAYPECIEQLRHGLQLVATLPAARRARHELDLLLPLGSALMAARGYAAREVEAVYERALALARQCGEPADLVRALRGHWNVAFVHRDIARARAAAGQLLALAESMADDALRADAHAKLGQTCLNQGDLPAARHHLQSALDSPAASADRAGLRGVPRVAAFLAMALWCSGEPRRAAEIGDTALDLASCTDSPHTRAFAPGYVGWLQLLLGDLARCRELAEQALKLGHEYGLDYWRQWAGFLIGAVQARRGETHGIAAMRAAIDALQASGDQVGVPHLCILAEAQLAAGRAGDARGTQAAAAELIAGTGNALYAAEARRIEALIALADGGTPARGVARRSFEAALDVARRQGARAFELRAACGLASLLADDGDAAHALALLAPLRAAFADGFATEDLVRADALLRELNEGADAPRSPG